MRKYSLAFERDWEFYLKNSDKFTFCGENIEWPFDVNGLSAKECFFIYDSRGEIKKSCEIELLIKILTTKKAINLQIKQWAEGMYDMGEPIEYYLKEFIEAPHWVEDGLRKQKLKALITQWPIIKKRMKEDDEAYRLHQLHFKEIAA